MAVIDTDNLELWVGKEKQAFDELGLFPAQALASVLEHKAMPAEGDALPPAWHWMYFLDTPTSSGTGADGHPQKGGFLPPVPLPRRMWAAGQMRIDHPVLLSQPAQKKSTIRSVDVKRGKSGALVFVTVEHAVHQGDRLCILEEQNIVYRDMPEGPSPLPPGELAPSNPDWVKTIAPDPVLLFRFSALTYNSHRIHYDRDYTVRNEYYPGLVVHGPLQATLLLDSIREHVPGKRAVQFAFRAIRPIFDTSEFKVIGHLDGNHIRLCTVDSEGFIGMTATAELA